jgi:hypothetical protein
MLVVMHGVPEVEGATIVIVFSEVCFNAIFRTAAL